MRLVIAGATGNIGTRTAEALEREGHDVVRISRSLGVDLLTGEGLGEALDEVEVVVDATNAPPLDRDATVSYFGTVTRNLLDAEALAGVRHHVLLSIVGVHRIEGNAHYHGKREQERLVEAGPVPWTIVPVTQFHDFAEMVAGWTEHNGTAEIAPLLIQPIAPDDVAEVLAKVALGDPQGRHADVAGPETQDLVDMARRTHQAKGRDIRLLPTWSGDFGPEMAGEVLLPAQPAHLTATSFETWLAARKPA